MPVAVIMSQYAHDSVSPVAINNADELCFCNDFPLEGGVEITPQYQLTVQVGPIGLFSCPSVDFS